MGDRNDPKNKQVPSGVFGNEAHAAHGTAAAPAQDSEAAAPRIVHTDGRPALHGNQSGTYRVDPAPRQQEEYATEGEMRALEQAIESELKTWSEPGLSDDDIDVDIDVEEPPSVIVDWRTAHAPLALKRDIAGSDDESGWQDDATTARGWRSRRSGAPPKPVSPGARWLAGVAVFGLLMAGAAGVWWNATRIPRAPSAPPSGGPAAAKTQGEGARGPGGGQGSGPPIPPAQTGALQQAASSMPARPADPAAGPDTRYASAREATRQRPAAEPSGRRPQLARTRGVEGTPEPAVEAAGEAEPEPASGSSRPATPKEAVGGAELPETLSREQVRAGLEALRPRIEACAAGRHGVAEARATIASSGKLMHAVIGDDFRGTDEGSCMARALRGASFPAFEDGPLNVRYPFSL